MSNRFNIPERVVAVGVLGSRSTTGNTPPLPPHDTEATDLSNGGSTAQSVRIPAIQSARSRLRGRTRTRERRMTDSSPMTGPEILDHSKRSR